MIGLENALTSLITICCILLLAGTVTETSVKRYAVSGKAYTLFTSADVENNDREVLLYINGLFFATWTWKNGTIEVEGNPYYERKINMDISRNIHIFEVDGNHSGTYCIKCNKTHKGIEVELIVLEDTRNIRNVIMEEIPKIVDKMMKNYLEKIQRLVDQYAYGTTIITVIIVIYCLIEKVLSWCIKKCRKRSEVNQSSENQDSRLHC